MKNFLEVNMKKTLCLILSLLLVVSAVFAGGSSETAAAVQNVEVTAELLSQHVGTPEEPVQEGY